MNYKMKGFTLVEMLVSMVLLSMVLAIASGAYSLFSSRWNGRLGHFNQSVHQAKQLMLVQESLKSIIAYATVNNEKQAKIYFEGNVNGFVAVTLRSIYSPQSAAVIRIQAVQNADFTYRLIYQESAMLEQLLIHTQQKLKFSEPIVLFNNLTSLEFEYFGWPSLESKNWTIDSLTPKPEPVSWFNEYNSLAINLQPEKIKITFTNEEGDFTLYALLNDSVPGMIFNYSILD